MAVERRVALDAVAASVLRVKERTGDQEVVVLRERFFQGHFQAVVAAGTIVDQAAPVNGREVGAFYEYRVKARGTFDRYIKQRLVVGFYFQTDRAGETPLVARHEVVAAGKAQVLVGQTVTTIRVAGLVVVQQQGLYVTVQAIGHVYRRAAIDVVAQAHPRFQCRRVVELVVQAGQTGVEGQVLTEPVLPLDVGLREHSFAQGVALGNYLRVQHPVK